MVRRSSGILVVGLMLMANGILSVKTGYGLSRKYPTPHSVGVLAIMCGAFLVLYALYGIRRTTKGGKRRMETTLICPRCEEVYERLKVPDLKCLRCGGALEPLDGFYERHPERRDQNGP